MLVHTQERLNTELRVDDEIKTNIQILIDIGGIAGGVCFHVWYLGICAVR